MQQPENQKILYSEVCETGIEITVIDQSRKIAGDRWLVKIQCTVESRTQVASHLSSPPETSVVDDVKGGMVEEDKVVKVFSRERNFVDTGERKSVMAELLAQLQTTIFPYLRTRSAGKKLLARHSSSERQQQDGTGADNRFAHLDSETGPADFSFLFSKG